MHIRKSAVKIFLAIFSLLLLSCFFHDTKKGDALSEKILAEARAEVEDENFIDAFELYNTFLFIDKTSLEGTLELVGLYERFREYRKAIDLINRYKTAKKESMVFDSILGELYYKMEEYDSATKYLKGGKVSLLKKAICFENNGNLNKAESLYTYLAPSLNEIAGFLSTRIAYCQVAKGVPESIVDLFSKLGVVIKEREKKYIVSKELLNNFVKNEQYDEALRLISLIEKDFPKRISTLELERANIYIALEKEEQAFQIFQNILDGSGAGVYHAGLKLLNAGKLKQKDYMKLAQICYSRGDYLNARNLLEERVKISRTDYTLFLLGMCYYKLGQNKNVVGVFRSLKDSYLARRETITYYLGRAEEKIGDYKSAKKDYGEVGKDKKSKLADNAIYLSALLEEDEGNFDRALDTYKFMKKEFKSGNYIYKALLRGGILSYRKNKLDQAEDFFTRARNLSRKGRSNYVSTLYWLGRVEEKRGNIEKRDSLWNRIKTETPLGYFSFYLKGSDIALPESNMKKWLSAWTDTCMGLTDKEKIYFERGKTFLDIGLVAEAEHSFSNINQTPIISYTLAKLFSEKGFDYHAILYSLKVKGRSPGSYYSRAPEALLKIEYPLLYLPSIIEKAKKYGVEPWIIVALIHQESAYRRTAVSSANAIGLTQLLPAVADEVARMNQIDYKGTEGLKEKPELSIELGVAHFSELIKKFKKYEFTLAAYNAGERKAKEWKRKWGDDIPTYLDMITYSETRDYVKRVLAKKEIYKTLWNLESDDKYTEKTETESRKDEK
jgi:hypothetical protein